MSNPWDFSTPIWYEEVEDYPAFTAPVGPPTTPVDGTTFSAFIVYSVSDTGVPYSQTRTVPLVLDHVTGTYSAKLSKVNQEERLAGVEVARITQEDQSFLARAGYLQT